MLFAKSATCAETTTDSDYTSPNISILKYVPAGTFQLDDDTANTSTVSAFRMSQHEITRTQFKAIMGADPSDTERSSSLGDPVQNVNWYHAIAFCNKLSLAEGLKPAYTVSGVDFSALSFSDIPTSSANLSWDATTCDWSANSYRLPTEMEWMWAAMGAQDDYNKSYAGTSLGSSVFDYAWYRDNSGEKTHPVGEKGANELGLYDMSGNVIELCWDWYTAYPANALTEFRGSGTCRILRGGCWNDVAGYLTVANRSDTYPYIQNYSFGFRVVRP